jgi:hypothetical protein
MNIRCAFCQTPYTLSRVTMLDALQEVDSKKLTHYDAHCPRCRRATPIPRQRLEMAMPKWRDELKQFEAEMKKNPQQEAPAPESIADTPQGAPVAAAESKPEPKTARAKQPAAKQKPAEEKPAKEKKATATKEKKTTKKSK